MEEGNVNEVTRDPDNVVTMVTNWLKQKAKDAGEALVEDAFKYVASTVIIGGAIALWVAWGCLPLWVMRAAVVILVLTGSGVAVAAWRRKPTKTWMRVAGITCLVVAITGSLCLWYQIPEAPIWTRIEPLAQVDQSNPMYHIRDELRGRRFPAELSYYDLLKEKGDALGNPPSQPWIGYATSEVRKPRMPSKARLSEDISDVSLGVYVLVRNLSEPNSWAVKSKFGFEQLKREVMIATDLACDQVACIVAFVFVHDKTAETTTLKMDGSPVVLE